MVASKKLLMRAVAIIYHRVLWAQGRTPIHGIGYFLDTGMWNKSTATTMPCISFVYISMIHSKNHSRAHELTQAKLT